MTRFIEAHRQCFGVEPICRELQVAPSSYYAARHRPLSARRVRDEALKVKLQHVHAEQFGVYGARKLWRQLHREGIPVAHCTVERLPREPRPPVVRYERERPGELLHIDTKKLGRFWHVGKRIRRDGVQRSPCAGWQHVHVVVDDHTRFAYAEVLPSDRRSDAVAFLERALDWYRERGITVERVMTDNAGAYRSRAWRAFCTERGIRHLRTRPYTPRTNGKAEALIKTLLREWAYRDAYPSSHHRTRALGGWLRWYNRRRPHGSLGGKPPVSRVSQVRGQYS